MIASIQHLGKSYTIDLSKPLDISLALHHGSGNVNAFHIPEPQFSPIVVGDYTGAVAAGAGSNCEVLTICAHGNGTHTECVGHISKERYTINQCLTDFWFVAELITIDPFRMVNDDFIILKEHISEQLNNKPEALIIRTLPNTELKKTFNYSGSNPSYLHWNAAKFIREQGIKHLLIDLPSIDREEDRGEMLAHKAFWNYPNAPAVHQTITELIYVPDTILDGTYLLTIQIAPLETDASPSKPLLYKIL